MSQFDGMPLCTKNVNRPCSSGRSSISGHLVFELAVFATVDLRDRNAHRTEAILEKNHYVGLGDAARSRVDGSMQLVNNSTDTE